MVYLYSMSGEFDATLQCPVKVTITLYSSSTSTETKTTSPWQSRFSGEWLGVCRRLPF